MIPEGYGPDHSVPSNNERENSHSQCVFCSMLDVMLPGGEGLAVVLHAYFDESGTHEGAPVLCVAGYVAEPEQWKSFCEEWTCLLKEKGLDYFHMQEIKNRSGSKLQKMLRSKDVEPLVLQFVDIIKKHIRYGLSVTIPAKEYRAVTPNDFRAMAGGPDAVCAQFAVISVADYARRNSLGPVIYYFAEGGPGGGHLEQTMARLMLDEKWRQWKEEFQIYNYGFVKMPDAPPAQAADVLAYLTTTSWNLPMPTTLTSLLEIDHELLHLDEQGIENMRDGSWRSYLSSSLKKGGNYEAKEEEDN